MSSAPPLVKCNDSILKCTCKKWKFNKNCKPKKLLINGKNGSYLAIDFSFGDVEKEKIDFNGKNLKIQNEIGAGKKCDSEDEMGIHSSH